MSTAPLPWICAIQGQPTRTLASLLEVARRDGIGPEVVQESCLDFSRWLVQLVRRVSQGQVRVLLVFTAELALGCCLANKLPGIRAAAVVTLAQARLALEQMGANVLLCDPQGKTWFELRHLLQACHVAAGVCPTALAPVFQEVETHAHR
jgi:hypothetical protein